MSYVSVEKIVKTPRHRVFEIFTQPAFYKRLMPEGLQMDLVSPVIKMKTGAEYEFKIVRWGIQQILSLRVEEFTENEEIVFLQSVGFFGRYRHTIKVKDHDETSTLVCHYIDYDLHFGLLGKLYDDLHLRRYMTKAMEEISLKLPKIAAGMQ